MNKKYIIGIVLLAVIGGAFVYVLTAPKESMMTSTESNDTELQKATTNQEEVGTATAKKGVYVKYSEATLDEAQGRRVLFFHAPWCPQCRELESDIKNNGVPAGVTILQVDYDTNQELRSEYGVTLQTTLVEIDENESLVKTFVAYDEPTIASVEANLLK